MVEGSKTFEMLNSISIKKMFNSSKLFLLFTRDWPLLNFATISSSVIVANSKFVRREIFLPSNSREDVQNIVCEHTSEKSYKMNEKDEARDTFIDCLT